MKEIDLKIYKILNEDITELVEEDEIGHFFETQVYKIEVQKFFEIKNLTEKAITYYWKVKSVLRNISESKIFYNSDIMDSVNLCEKGCITKNIKVFIVTESKDELIFKKTKSPTAINFNPISPTLFSNLDKSIDKNDFGFLDVSKCNDREINETNIDLFIDQEIPTYNEFSTCIFVEKNKEPIEWFNFLFEDFFIIHKGDPKNVSNLLKENEQRLYKIVNKNFCRIFAKEINIYKNINLNNVLVLLMENYIFIWIGLGFCEKEILYAKKIADRLRFKNQNIVICNEKNKFLAVLGKKDINCEFKEKHFYPIETNFKVYLVKKFIDEEFDKKDEDFIHFEELSYISQIKLHIDSKIIIKTTEQIIIWHGLDSDRSDNGNQFAKMFLSQQNDKNNYTIVSIYSVDKKEETNENNFFKYFFNFWSEEYQDFIILYQLYLNYKNFQVHQSKSNLGYTEKTNKIKIKRQNYLKSLQEIIGEPTKSFENEYLENIVPRHKRKDKITEGRLKLELEKKHFIDENGLDWKERLSILMHTKGEGTLCKKTNELLRNLQKEKDQTNVLNEYKKEIELYKTYLFTLYNAIKKLSKIQQKNEEIFFRDIKLDEKQGSAFVEKVFLNKAILEYSFSTFYPKSEHNAIKESKAYNIRIICYCKKNDHYGLHFPAKLGKYADPQFQNEILFPPMTLFEIFKCSHKNDEGPDEYDFHVVPTFRFSAFQNENSPSNEFIEALLNNDHKFIER